MHSLALLLSLRQGHLNLMTMHPLCLLSCEIHVGLLLLHDQWSRLEWALHGHTVELSWVSGDAIELVPGKSFCAVVGFTAQLLESLTTLVSCEAGRGKSGRLLHDGWHLPEQLHVALELSLAALVCVVDGPDLRLEAREEVLKLWLGFTLLGFLSLIEIGLPLSHELIDNLSERV